MGDSLTLALRVGFSFTVVLGLMWAAARVLRGKYGDRGAGTLEVLARQQVGRSATVTVVRVGDRALVLGVTEQGVTLLGDPITDLGPFAPAVPSPDEKSLPLKAGSLDGSLLSPGTWRAPLDALRERTVRRG
jgi:flagellar protein FliO/FliZ